MQSPSTGAGANPYRNAGIGAYDLRVGITTKRREAGQENDAAQVLMYLEAARIALRRTFEDDPSVRHTSFADR